MFYFNLARAWKGDHTATSRDSKSALGLAYSSSIWSSICEGMCVSVCVCRNFGTLVWTIEANYTREYVTIVYMTHVALFKLMVDGGGCGL